MASQQPSILRIHVPVPGGGTRASLVAAHLYPDWSGDWLPGYLYTEQKHHPGRDRAAVNIVKWRRDTSRPLYVIYKHHTPWPSVTETLGTY